MVRGYVSLDALPDKNNGVDFCDMVDEIKTKPDSSRFLCFTKGEFDRLKEILAPEIDGMVKLWEEAYTTMRKIVVTRAPKYIHGMIDGIIPSLFYFEALGIICGSILDSGKLNLPDFDYPAAVCFVKE